MDHDGFLDVEHGCNGAVRVGNKLVGVDEDVPWTGAKKEKTETAVSRANGALLLLTVKAMPGWVLLQGWGSGGARWRGGQGRAATFSPPRTLVPMTFSWRAAVRRTTALSAATRSNPMQGGGRRCKEEGGGGGVEGGWAQHGWGGAAVEMKLKGPTPRGAGVHRAGPRRRRRRR